jgi:hypothetical protein
MPGSLRAALLLLRAVLLLLLRNVLFRSCVVPCRARCVCLQ